MAYEVGAWVEFVRDVDRARAGDRGRVTSTGFLGGHDVTLENGDQITGVSGDALRSAPGGSSGGDLGCAVVGLALVSAAATVLGAASGWWA